MSAGSVIDASLVVYTARLEGLVPVLESAARQEFNGVWELLVVDGACHERKEVVACLWDTLYHQHALSGPGPDRVPLVHVPPLKPIGRDYYRTWDIPLYQHTAWSYARGRIVVQAEDHCTFGPKWLARHVDFVRAHPNLVGIGDVFDAATGAPHYGRKTCEETLREWSLAYPSLLERFNEKKPQYICANADAYGYWLSGNTSIDVHGIMRASPFIEAPSHYPEATNIPQLFAAGLSMWPLVGVPLRHHAHQPGGIVKKVIVARDPYGEWLDHEVRPQASDEATFETARRDIAAERRRLGRWPH